MKNVFLLLSVAFSLLMSSAVMAANKFSQSPQAVSPSNQVKVEPKSRTVSALGVWLHSMDVSLYQDLDQDGFHQNLRIKFDLDTNAAYRDVEMNVWLKAPEGHTELIFKSTTIALSGDSYNDAQQVDIQFVDDYVEDYYSLELVIVDKATNQEIFHVSEFDDQRLQSLAIEGQSYDQTQTISVYSADIDLYNDDNQNGFYHQASVSFDVDVPFGSADLIAEFYLDGQLIHTSRRFTIYGSATNDKQYFDIEMVSGLQPGYYDLDIHILDADDLYQRHHIAAVDWVVFTDLPLESYYWDHHYEDEVEVHIDQSAGNLGIAIFGLLVIALMRRFKRYKAI